MRTHNFFLQQLTKKEDPEVIKRRREKNKIAAMKCRRKRKERISIKKKVIKTRILSRRKSILGKTRLSVLSLFATVAVGVSWSSALAEV